MGSSWVFVADVSLPPECMPAWLAASASPAPWRDWPRDLASDDADPGSVSDVLDDFARAPHVELTRREEGISLRAIVPGDGDAWLTLRTPLAAAIRAAGAHGGSGELAICGWTDGDARTVLRVGVAPGSSVVESLRGAPAHALRARAHAAVEPLEDRIAAASRKDSLELPPAVARVHADVMDALARVPDDALLRAAQRSVAGFQRGRGPDAYGTLAQHFPDAPALRDALQRGFARMNPMEAQRLPAVALEILRYTDPLAAAACGRAYLDARAAFFVAAEAAAATIPFDGSPRDVLAHVRTHVPPYVAWAEHAAVEREPVVVALVSRVDAPLRAEARATLDALLASELDEAGATFAYVLTLLLEVDADAETERALIELWTSRREPGLAAYERAWRHGLPAKQAFARYFARDRRDAPRLARRQEYAAAALLELDPDEALARLRALLDAAERSELAATSLLACLGQLPPFTALATPAWLETLAAIGVHRTLGLGPMVRTVLGAWKVKPHTSPAAPHADAPASSRADGVSDTPGRTPGHRIEVSPSGRAACRACKEKIAKGALRFGELAPNAYDDDSLRWFHLRCAAEKRAKVFAPVLAAYAGEVPERAELDALLAPKAKKPRRA